MTLTTLAIKVQYIKKIKENAFIKNVNVVYFLLSLL